MRLIDADAYRAEMEERRDRCAEWRDEAKACRDVGLFVRADGALATFIEAKLTLDKMPTIDAVPVVRCGECIHNYGLSFNGEFIPNDIVCLYWDTDGLSYNDFCSYGERKDGDGNG